VSDAFGLMKVVRKASSSTQDRMMDALAQLRINIRILHFLFISESGSGAPPHGNHLCVGLNG